MPAVVRPFAIFLLMLILLMSVPTLALGADAETQACPAPIGEGVVCTGPTAPRSYLPVVQVDRPCPQPVGGGVICTGPDVPQDAPPVKGQISTPAMAVGLFLPMINR